MALGPPAKLEPPTQQPPLADTGAFSEPWAMHNQKIVDRLHDLPGELSAGVVDGSDAAAGAIGEVLTHTGASVALATATAANVATLALPAGDWSVEGSITFTPDALTVPVRLMASMSGTSAAAGAMATDLRGLAALVAGTLISTFSDGQPQRIGSGGALRLNLAAPGTAYLVGRASYAVAATLAPGGTVGAVGVINARRMR